MTYSHHKSKTRSITPIYEKISPIKLMNLAKAFSSMAKTKFSCYVLTTIHENTWTFKYTAPGGVSIVISFEDRSTKDYPQIIIEEFIFPKYGDCARLNDKILRLLISHIQRYDFEQIVFQIKSGAPVDLFKYNGFKQRDLMQMTLSLKPKFINRMKSENENGLEI